MKKKFAVTLTVLGLVALVSANCEILDPPQWGAMEVLVTDEHDEPLADVAVARWDADQRRRSGKTDKNGVWVDRNVRKGNYRIEAVGRYTEDDQLEPVSARPSACSVKAREKAQCRLIVEGG
ncbi:MAG: carboxypeptidase-like regulatory domain-containing protein [Gemmatimonadetes bacterium]|nr:carboxypeptidase-like regulatory domain-containing protein [Gemmatimonadota bacterium]